MLEKNIVFTLALLTAFPGYAIDSLYLQCFNDFPDQVDLTVSEILKETLGMKSVSNYEEQQQGAGYGLHYQRNYTNFGEYMGSFCQTSLFIYDRNEGLISESFSSDELISQILEQEKSMEKSNKRERISPEEMGLPECDTCPENSEPVAMVAKETIKGHDVYFVDDLFKDSVERKAVMEYDGNYLKLLLTCQSLPLDTMECTTCLENNERENCPDCERDLEFDKNHLGALSDSVLNMAIDTLNNCKQKKGK